MHITFGHGAQVNGLIIGNGNQAASGVTAHGNFVQNTGGNVTITQTQSNQQGLSLEEVLELFGKIQNAVNDVEGVPRKVKIEAKAEVEKALAEIEEPESGKEPDKQAVATYLKNAATVLKEAGATALQAASFGKLVAQGVGWLGANYQWLLEML